MALEQRDKRARPVPKGSQKSQKRQKIASQHPEIAVTTDLPSDVRRVPVAADALPWNEVAMPEMFDDAEGFFGLEEIEGVEIVRDGGKVQFVSSKAKPVIDEDEFEGFSDNDAAAAVPAKGTNDLKPVGSTKTTKPAKPMPVAKGAMTAEDELKKKKAEEKKERRRQEKLRQKETVDTEVLKSSKAAKTSEKSKKENMSSKATAPKNQPAAIDVDIASDTVEEDDSELETNIFAALEEDANQEETDVSEWAELDLSAEMMSALSKLGFSTPTQIQQSAIPEILAGHDVIGKASTGSGKTLAFGIPVVERWLESQPAEQDERVNKSAEKVPTALILSPTRELAHQLTEHIAALCKGLSTPPYIAAVTGGLSVQKQQRQLARADIIIGTPGRLWEVMSSSKELTRTFKLLKFLVIDEADRLLTEGHFKEATEILGALDRKVDAEEGDETPPDRQTLIFSATFNKGLQQKLAGKGKHGLADKADTMEYLLQKVNFREEKPKFIDVNPISQMAEGLKEGMIECAGTEKDLFLYSLLMYHPNQRTLIFTNSIHSVRRLTPLLANLNLPAHALHSQMAQKARMRSIERFSSPKATSSILVATDVAARGLDIGGVNLVIHYHLPRTADMYVHRSGRTARASATGSSILICCPEEVVGTRRLVAKVHAQNAIAGAGKKSKFYIRSLDIDRKVVARLKPRVVLAKKIADSGIAKEKKGHDDVWVKNAAEELGVDYDSEDFESQSGMRKGRGTGRRQTEKEARAMSKGEVGAIRAKLKELLDQRVNVGTSERYLTSGTVNIDELLKGMKGEFLGQVDGIGME